MSSCRATNANALADRVAVLERRAGLVPPEDADPPARNDAALAAAVSRAWSALDSAVDGCPAGYAWLHDAVREARDAVGEIGELLRAEAPPTDPPIVTPDAALAVMVGLDRGADGGEPTASRAGIDDPVVVPPGYSLDIGPWEPGDDDDYDYDDDDPSPWRPLPDPECPADALVWVTFSERRGVRLARAATMRRWADGTLRWYTQGIGGHKIELTEVLAWMPLPEPWRGGR